MTYFLHLLIFLDIYVIVALSLNLVVGYSGLLTLAHAAYFAIGSYVYSLIVLKLGWGFLVATILGMGVAAILSLVLSLSSWRLKGDFFVMSSLAIQALIYSLLYNWSSPGIEPGTWANLTNGPYGLTGMQKPEVLGLVFSNIWLMAVLATITTIGCAILVWLLVNSPWGRLLKSVRDDELAARGLGKNVHMIKSQMFAISCGMVAISGALYAAYIGYVDPSVASLDQSILMLSMVIVGGVGNFRGPIVGALVLLVIPELLRFAQIPDAAAANVRLIIYGLLLIVMMHYRPQGLAGEYRLD